MLLQDKEEETEAARKEVEQCEKRSQFTCFTSTKVRVLTQSEGGGGTRQTAASLMSNALCLMPYALCLMPDAAG
jgi:hypothetical protein